MNRDFHVNAFGVRRRRYDSRQPAQINRSRKKRVVLVFCAVVVVQMQGNQAILEPVKVVQSVIGAIQVAVTGIITKPDIVGAVLRE
jgi:hypothetical protein